MKRPMPRLQARSGGHHRSAGFAPQRSAQRVMNIEAARLENFLAEAREKAGQLRAIIKLPAREPQAFREKLVLILELIRGINARAQRLPLPSVCERAERFEAALSSLRDKQTLSGNDFLPLAVKLDDLLSHLAIQGEVISRLREWRVQNGLTSSAAFDVTQRSATATGTTIRQPQLRGAGASSTTVSQPGARHAKNRAPFRPFFGESRGDGRVPRRHVRQARLPGRRGLEDVPRATGASSRRFWASSSTTRSATGRIPLRARAADKPELGTMAVQFARRARTDSSSASRTMAAASTTTRYAPKPYVTACLRRRSPPPSIPASSPA